MSVSVILQARNFCFLFYPIGLIQFHAQSKALELTHRSPSHNHQIYVHIYPYVSQSLDDNVTCDAIYTYIEADNVEKISNCRSNYP